MYPPTALKKSRVAIAILLFAIYCIAPRKFFTTCGPGGKEKSFYYPSVRREISLFPPL